MGWSDGSEMPRLYNLRHLQEEASSIGLKAASDTARPDVFSKETLVEAKILSLVVANTK